MDKYKISSPRLEELKRKKAKVDDEIRMEHARLARDKVNDLCAEMRKRNRTK